MPITAPLESTSAPPEFPGLIAASVWMRPLMDPLSVVMSRPSAETMPAVTELVYTPRGEPIAIAV